MTEREQFEAWWLKDVPENHRDFAKKLLTEYGQDYVAAPGVADAWTAWQASRRAALEEAENIARLYDLGTPEGHYIADSIRRLSTGDTNNG